LHAVLSFAALAAFAVVADRLGRVSDIGPLNAGTLGLAAGGAAIFVLNRWQNSHAVGQDARGSLALQTIVFLSLLVDYALYATLLTRQPLVQPVALLGLTSLAAFLFAVAGYLRLSRRQTNSHRFPTVLLARTVNGVDEFLAVL
jgi:hypothetical protein